MVRTNFAKLYQATGFQRFPSYYQYDGKRVLQARIDHNGIDHALVTPSSSHCDSSINEHNSYSATYSKWVKDHPSALSSFDPIINAAEGKIIVVFLDYDGTLSPIVDDPDRAFMSEEMRSAVREVAKCFPTAIITGRSRDKVKEFVQLTNVYYAGSHGMDIMVPSNKPKHCNGKYSTISFDKEVSCSSKCKLVSVVQLL